MNNSGIWLVTDVRTEARHLANLAAYRANLDTGAWIARAICRTLDLPEPAVAPASAETEAPQSSADEAFMVSALKEMGDRLERPLGRPGTATPLNTRAPEAPTDSEILDETQPDGKDGPAGDATPRIDPLAPLPTPLPVPDPSPLSRVKPRLSPWLTALAATILVFAAPLAYVATSDLGDLPARARSSAGEFMQNLRAIAQSTQKPPEIRPATVTETKPGPRPHAMPARPEQPAKTGPLPALRLAATSGDRRSQYELGMRYATGQGLARDTRRAALWLHRAAAQGSADAQYNLAALYATADGASKNLKKAFVLYKRAADRGHPRAMHNLGIAFAVGQGTDVDMGEALRLLEASVRKGVAMASYNLGVFNEFGLTTAPDPVTAMQWYRHAVENGAAHAVGRLRQLSSIVGSGGTVPSEQRVGEGQTLLRPLPLDTFPAAPAVADGKPAGN